MSSTSSKPYRRLPELVRLLAFAADATIVGSAAKYMVDGVPGTSEPRDWDLIVPYQDWQRVALTLHHSTRMNLNSFGGIHAIWEENGQQHELDVWPSSIEEYLASGKPSKLLYKPRGGRVIRIEEI